MDLPAPFLKDVGMTVEERERQLNLYGSSQEHDSLVFPVSTGELCPPTGLNPAHDCVWRVAESQVFSMKILEKYIKKLYKTTPLRDEKKTPGLKDFLWVQVFMCICVCI